MLLQIEKVNVTGISNAILHIRFIPSRCKNFLYVFFWCRGLGWYHQDSTLKAFAHFGKLLTRFAFFIFLCIWKVDFF